MHAWKKRSWFLAIAVVLLIAGPSAANAQGGGGGVTPPDLTVCDGVGCPVTTTTCKAGFRVTLTNFVAPEPTNSGTASYTYQTCSPSLGVCQGGTGWRAGHSCKDNNHCRIQGQQLVDPGATCTRDCAIDSFHNLSHFDVTFPQLGNSCLGNTTLVTGSCSNGNFVLGDGSCFAGISNNKVAKCDNTNLNPGQCLTMTVNIPGEGTGLGLGAAIVVDKEGNTCTSACLSGPSCAPCNGDQPNGEKCLTRTLGFWGNHPWITNDYTPITVCGKTLGCAGLGDGKSNPSCQAGNCNSVMEGLGSIPSELPGNQPYVAMVKQLTAAKLNLQATAAAFSGASCSSWRVEPSHLWTIQEWITRCEGLCGADRTTITNSGCIEALNAFNNSIDVLNGGPTPTPFDRPPVDDYGNISGADSRYFTAAQRGGVVIGKGSCALVP